MFSYVTGYGDKRIVSCNIIFTSTVRKEPSVTLNAVVHFRFFERQRQVTAFILVNWDGETSEFAENPDYLIFLWK